MPAQIERLHQPPAPREILAGAIGRHATAVANAAHVDQALVGAEQKVYAAADRLKAAETQLAEAKADEGAYLAATALDENDGSLSVADVELGVTLAADDLARARATRDALKKRGEREATEASKSERAVADAIVGVFRSEAPIGAMLARAQDLQRQLIDMRLQLRWLQKTNCISPDMETAVRNFLLDAALPAGTGAIENGNWSGTHPATEKWLAAAAALKEEASAKLPPSS